MRAQKTDQTLQDRCLQFGAAVLRMAQTFAATHGSNSRLYQLEKSATSIGANVAEAKSAHSRADFISKFEIALKEARETDYWLRLLRETNNSLKAELSILIGECWQITAILVTSVKTAKRNGGIEEPRLVGHADSRE